MEAVSRAANDTETRGCVRIAVSAAADDTRLTEGVNWTADGTMARRSTENGVDAEVLLDVAHGDVLERGAAVATLAVERRVPDLDVALGGLIGDLEGGIRSALTSVVHGSLDHVARSATVVCTRAVAVMLEGREAVGWEQADGTSAVHGTLELRQVVGAWEGLLDTDRAKLASSLSVLVGEEETRAAERSLLHDRGVAELLDQCLATLDGGV